LTYIKPDTKRIRLLTCGRRTRETGFYLRWTSAVKHTAFCPTPVLSALRRKRQGIVAGLPPRAKGFQPFQHTNRPGFLDLNDTGALSLMFSAPGLSSMTAGLRFAAIATAPMSRMPRRRPGTCCETLDLIGHGPAWTARLSPSTHPFVRV